MLQTKHKWAQLDTSGHTGQTLTDKWILNGHGDDRATRTDVNDRSKLKRTLVIKRTRQHELLNSVV